MYRFQGLDSLMTAKGITDSGTFDAYLKEVLSKRESQDANLTGFVYDTPQLDFSFKVLQAEAKIDVMASYVDLNSPAVPSGHKVEMTSIEGSVPRMKYAVVQGENDYRKQLIALNEVQSVARFNNTSETVAVKNFLSRRLFFNLDEIVTSFKESLNFQVGQMTSKGALTIDDKSNPRGSIRTTFKAQVPEKNFITKKWFTKAAEGSLTPVADADPITDLRDFIRELRWKANGYQNVTVQMSERYIYKLLSHPAVLKAVGYASTGLGLRYTKQNDDNALAVARGMALEALKEVFTRLIECDELITSKTQCGVEKLNTTSRKYERTLMDAFADETIVIRPQGNIGVIKNVVPLRPDGQAIVGSIFGGKGIIEYMYNRDTREQRWQGEMTALAVLTRPQDMYYFNGVEDAASYTAVASPTGNPSTSGYYEKQSDGSYVLSTDTTVQSGKTYYTKN